MPASAPQCQVVGSMKPAAALERHEMVNDVAGAPRPSPGGARLLHHREDVRGAHRRRLPRVSRNNLSGPIVGASGTGASSSTSTRSAAFSSSPPLSAARRPPIGSGTSTLLRRPFLLSDRAS